MQRPLQYTIRLFLLLPVILFFAASLSFAQITVTTGQTPQQYLDAFSGPGVVAFNPVFTGDNGSIGSFTRNNGTPAIGVPGGIILSTGDVADIETQVPNTNDATGSITGGGTDADLAGLVSVAVNDAAVFSFSFVPDRDSVFFRYIFASEEYNEFANSTFNDVFAFFISGPGIVGKQNIALIPGTATPVSINNVNLVNNPGVYNSNDPSDTPFGQASAEMPDFMFDGYTDVFTAVASGLNPCDTYLLELKIGDGGDSSYDSAVFLEAGSFGNPLSVPGAQFAGLNDSCQRVFVIKEGCDEANIRVQRPAGSAGTTDTTFLDYSGSSVNLVTDFTTPLPPFVVFPPGIDSIILPLEAASDTLTEPNDSLVFRAISNGQAAQELVLRIEDSDTINLVSPTVFNACEGDTVIVNPDITGNFRPEDELTYRWIVGLDTISTDSILEVVADSSFSVKLEVEDTCGVVPGNWFITISTDYADPVLDIATISQAKFVCEGDSVTLEGQATGGLGAYTYIWEDPNGGSIGIGPSINFTPTLSGQYRMFVQDTCLIQSAAVTVNIEEEPGLDFALSETEICEGETVEVSFLGPDTSAVSYSWSFNAAQPASSAGIGPFTLAYPFSGTFDISLSASGQVCIVDTTQTIEVAQRPIISAGPDKTICANLDFTLDGNVNHPAADTGGCTIEWVDLALDSVVGTTQQVIVSQLSVSRQFELRATCGGCTGTPDTVQINVNPTPSLTIPDPDIEKCEGAPAVNTTLIPIGAAPYTFSWTPSIGVNVTDPQNPAFNPNATTTFEVQMTDGNGCSLEAPEEVTVTVQPQPVADAGAAVTICVGDDVTLNGSAIAGSGNYSYQWSPATGLSNPNIANPVASPTTTTTYTLVVTDNTTGCVSSLATASSTVTVSVTQLPTISPDDDNLTICGGDSVGIGVLSHGNNPDYSFSWSPTTGLADPNSGFTLASPAATTTYELVVTRGGCDSDPQPVTVKVEDLPVITIPTVDPICPQSGSVQLEPNIANIGAGATYSWTPTTGLSTPNAPNPVASPTVPTTYTLTASYGSGCEDTASVFVGIAGIGPDFDADIDTDNNYRSLCDDVAALGVSITASAPAGANGQWLHSGSTSPTTTVSPATTTDYIWQATYANGCQAQDTVTVAVKPSVEIDFEVTGDSVCYGNAIAVDVTAGTGAAAFQWTPSAGVDCPTCDSVNITPPITNSGYTVDYQVRVEENGCADSVTITLTSFPEPVADFTFAPERGCQPLEVNFTNYSTNATAYEWFFGNDSTSSAFEPTHTYEDVGVYQPMLIAYAGPDSQCVDTAMLVRDNIQVLDSIQVDFTASQDTTDTLYIPAANISFTDLTPDAVAWFWDFGDGVTSNQQNPSHLYQLEGDYTVTLTATALGGCQDTATMGAFIVRIEELPATPSVFTPNDDGINDEFWVDYEGDEPFEIRVVSRTGNLVFSSTNPQERWSPNESEVTEGVYFWLLTIGERKYEGTVTILK